MLDCGPSYNNLLVVSFQHEICKFSFKTSFAQISVMRMGIKAP